jgi:hypothetical protein
MVLTESVAAAAGADSVLSAREYFESGDSMAAAKRVMAACAEASAEFAASPPLVLPPAVPQVYVHQKEYATVPLTVGGSGSPLVHYIGSSDATTCLIIVLQSANRVGVCHVDTDTCGLDLCRASGFIDEVADTAEVGTLTAFLCGSYAPTHPGDAKSLESSLKAVSSTLASLMACKHLVDVKVACMLEHNTLTNEDTETPRTTAMLFDCATGTAHHGVFESRGPEMPLRSARMNCEEGGLPNETSRVYDSDTDCYVITPFKYQALPKATAQYVLALDDESLLQMTSTSPRVEPPGFCEDMRRFLRWVIANPRWKTVFAGDKPVIVPRASKE